MSRINVPYTHQRFKSRKDYDKAYLSSLKDPESFWKRESKALLWNTEWKTLFKKHDVRTEWFPDGALNISENCLDRHLHTDRANQNALIFEGEPGEVRTYTYRELHDAVAQASSALLKLGIQKGDRVAIYMPLIPEAVISMLACVRIGAIHSVVFGGFSAHALADRINDAKAACVITADGGYRRGHVVPLKETVDEALTRVSHSPHVLVVKRTNTPITLEPGRDLLWDEVVSQETERAPAVSLPAAHPSFILYTSGSTGKPKGVVHSTGGYLMGAHLTTQTVFDLRPEDRYWCTADIGWITGHTYVVYGPLSVGSTVFIYEGAPNHPNPGRFWEIIERHQLNVLYTAPTAIRSFMKWGNEWLKNKDLSSLRLLGSVGEPINPEAWKWYFEHVGQRRCPVVDTWWQTETGSILITTLPGVHEMEPGVAGVPMLGVDPAVVDEAGATVPTDQSGLLILNRSWPSQMLTIYKDDDRFKKTYFEHIPGRYLAGDSAKSTADHYYTILGRIDDVVNVSGHRLGTAEIESALVAHPTVVEAAVVSRPDPIKGEAIVAFVTLAEGVDDNEELHQALRTHVASEIGALARPEEVRVTPELPKTRSGKIMRRLLRSVARGEEIQGDLSTLESTASLEAAKKK